MKIFNSIAGAFTSKWALIGLGAMTITIAALYGYIQLQSAQHKSEEIALRSRLRELRDDVKKRDEALLAANNERELFDSRLADINSALEGMQGRIASNSTQRRNDYTVMTRPRPAPGTPADTSEMEQAANTGMNGIFNQMEADSKSVPLNDEGTTK